MSALIRSGCLLSLLIASSTSAVTKTWTPIGNTGTPDFPNAKAASDPLALHNGVPDNAIAPVTAFFEAVDELAAIIASDDERSACSDSFGQPLNKRQLMLFGQTFGGAQTKFVEQNIDGDHATVRGLVFYGGGPQWRTFELRRTGEEWRVFSISPPPREPVPLAEVASTGPEVAESQPVRQVKQFMLLMKTAGNVMMPSHEGMNVMLLWVFVHGRQCGAWKSVEIGGASEWKHFSSTGFQIPVTLRGGTQKTSQWRFIVEPNAANDGKLAIDNLDTEPLAEEGREGSAR